MVPMRFAFKTVVVKMTPVGKISMVLPIEPGMIMVVIGAVVIVAMPCWIGIIGVSRIDAFIDANLHMNLCAGGIDRHGGRDDQCENK